MGKSSWGCGDGETTFANLRQNVAFYAQVECFLCNEPGLDVVRQRLTLLPP